MRDRRARSPARPDRRIAFRAVSGTRERAWAAAGRGRRGGGARTACASGSARAGPRRRASARSGERVAGGPALHRGADLARAAPPWRASWASRSGACGEPLDLAFDGADAVDPDGLVVKGAGGALVRERLVADSAARFLILVDAPEDRRLARRLGHAAGGGGAVRRRRGGPRARRPGARAGARGAATTAWRSSTWPSPPAPTGARSPPGWRHARASWTRASSASTLDRVLIGEPRRRVRHGRGGGGRRYDPRVAAPSLTLARAAGRLSRRLGRGGGTSLPGKLLLRMRPEALAELGAELPRGVTLISATNGKTTTARLLAACARRAGWDPVTNPSGANLLSGVATALLDAPRPHARRPTSALFEVDEAALTEVARQLPAAGAAADEPLPRPARPLRGAGAPRRPLGADGGGPAGRGPPRC